jgi:hypothetical protein
VKRFCADTSALIAAWNERYPPDHFPGLWDKIGDLIKEGRLFAPDEVRNELRKRSVELATWLEAFDEFFYPTTEDILIEVAFTLQQFPKLVMEHKVAFAADPFVIALATLERCVVLTEEGPGSEKRPKIPFVCRTKDVECSTLLELIRAEGWVLAG